MTLAPGVGVHAQHGHLAGGAAGIRVLGGADRAQADDLVAGARDEQAVDAARAAPRGSRATSGRTRRARSGRRRRRERGRHTPRGRRPPARDRRQGLVLPGPADAGVGERAGVAGRGRCSCSCSCSCGVGASSLAPEAGLAALAEGQASLDEVLARPGFGERRLVPCDLGVVVVRVEAELGPCLGERGQGGRARGEGLGVGQVAAVLREAQPPRVVGVQDSCP